MVYPVKPGGYWREWENVLAEMPTVRNACGVAEQMPTQQQFCANGYTSLYKAIQKHYGGMYKFAERLDQPYRGRVVSKIEINGMQIVTNTQCLFQFVEYDCPSFCTDRATKVIDKLKIYVSKSARKLFRPATYA